MAGDKVMTKDLIDSDLLDDFPTTPVPLHRTGPAFRISLIIAAVSFALPNMVAGLELGAGLGVERAIGVFTIAAVILTLLAYATSWVGSKNRFSSYMLIQFCFGKQGAKLVNLLFAIAMLGWFGINIDLLSDAMDRVFRQLLQVSVPLWIFEIGAGLLITLTTLFGVRLIDKLALLFVPVLVGICLLMLVRVLQTEADHSSLSGGLAFGEAVSATVGGVIVGVVLLPDFSRFIRHPHQVWWLAVIPFLIAEPLVLLVAALAGDMLAERQALALMLGLGLGWGAFLLVIMSSWILNSMNLYSCSLSVASFVSLGKEWQQVLVLGVLGTFAASLNLLDNFVSFLFLLAIIFAPVAGIYIADFILLRAGKVYQLEELESAPAVYWPAVLAWLMGIGCSYLSSQGSIFITGIEAVDAVAVAVSAYCLLSRIAKKA